MSGLTARVKRFEQSIESQKAFQDEKDNAQDMMLEMELERISQEINGRASMNDLEKLEKKFQVFPLFEATNTRNSRWKLAELLWHGITAMVS